MQHHAHIHGADPQVNAAANAADRANRPMGLLVIAIGAAVAMGAWLVVALVNMNAASTDYDRERRRQTQLVYQINEIRNLEAQSPSLESLYGKSADGTIMPNHLRDVARAVWGLGPDDRVESIATIPSQPKLQTLTTVPGLQGVDVTVTIQNQSIEKILEFIDASLEFEFLSTTFVLNLDLTPRRPDGWGAEITFRRYTAVRQRTNL